MAGKIRIGIMVLLVISIIAGGSLLVFDSNRKDYPVEISLPEISGDIEVYVSGEVQFDGMYLLPEGARTQDLLDAAGGLTADADFGTVNPAALLHDGTQIHVPAKGESSQRININTAESWLLDALPGVGETLAERIVTYRVENGPFSCLDDLKNVEGMRQSAIEQIRDKVTVR